MKLKNVICIVGLIGTSSLQLKAAGDEARFKTLFEQTYQKSKDKGWQLECPTAHLLNFNAFLAFLNEGFTFSREGRLAEEKSQTWDVSFYKNALQKVLEENITQAEKKINSFEISNQSWFKSLVSRLAFWRTKQLPTQPSKKLLETTTVTNNFIKAWNHFIRTNKKTQSCYLPTREFIENTKKYGTSSDLKKIFLPQEIGRPGSKSWITFSKQPYIKHDNIKNPENAVLLFMLYIALAAHTIIDDQKILRGIQDTQKKEIAVKTSALLARTYIEKAKELKNKIMETIENNIAVSEHKE